MKKGLIYLLAILVLFYGAYAELTIEGVDYLLWYNVNTPVATPPFPDPDFHFNNWVLTPTFVSIPATINVVSSLNVNSFLPPENISFQMTSTLLINVNIPNIKIVVSNGNFKFPADVTKEIQVEMIDKNGKILKSNKINLIVT
jgi:hypothetical protein